MRTYPDTLDRFLITGASGMVGRSIRWGQRLGRSELDVIDFKKCRGIIHQRKPSGILHLAALDIRQCEKDPVTAYRVNVLASQALARLAAESNIPFVFLSSGAVFNGPINACFDEDSPPSPVNRYGRTKVAAESLVTRESPNALIVRTGWLFGGHGAHGRKFVDDTIERIKRGERVSASTDQTGSFTLVEDLIDAIESLVLARTTGVRHIVNDGRATAFELAAHLSHALGSSATIAPIPPRDLPREKPPRSASEVLSSRFLKLRPWQDALQDYVSRTETH